MIFQILFMRIGANKKKEYISTEDGILVKDIANQCPYLLFDREKHLSQDLLTVLLIYR